MQAQEIRFGLRRRIGYPLRRSLAQHVSDVAGPLRRGLAFIEVVFAAVADMGVVSREPTHHAEELLIAALQRAVSWQIAEMPFPDKGGAVSGAPEQRGQRWKAWRHAHIRRLSVAPAQRFRS